MQVVLVANQTWRRELPVTAADGGPIWQLQAQVEAALVAELARPEPTLRVEACGQILELSSEQLAILARFAVVNRDLSAQRIGASS